MREIWKRMKEQYLKWLSPNTGTEIEMSVFGHAGIPLVAFPTSLGKFHQNKDFKLIESVRWYVENGLVKIYCIDGIDEISWYNKKIEPYIRIYNHTCYDNMIHNELLPYIKTDTGRDKVITAGCSFGGYHAANYAFRHPENVSNVIAMGASFDIKDLLNGYNDDSVYFNNPPDYLPDNKNPNLWDMKIILGTTEEDPCKNANIDMSYILDRKGMKHLLDIRNNGGHDWPVWCQMFPHYLSLI